ncbi:MAG: GAF domain-containing protein, partial [Flavobacteriales bacterium]|nr:GAF domain-containing protein [Flavobacteriales bacterium]
VVKSQKSEIINYSSDDTDYYYIDKPSESEITVPIIFEGELLGIIDSEHIRSNFFSKEHLYLLEDIAEALAIRLVQKKRQDDNLKFHSTLSLLYNQGKIFDFNFDLKTKKINDSCIDNIIYLIGINDTSKKIEIYNDSTILLDYVLRYDVDKLSIIEENLENSVIKTKEITFRIITELGFIKWLKMTVSNFNKNKTGKILSIDGTIQDITNIKKLESKSKGLENLQSSVELSKKQLETNGDITKTISLVGHTINVSEIIISKFDANQKNKLINHIKWTNNKADIENNSGECFTSKLTNFEEKLKSNLTIEIPDFEENSIDELVNINSFISIPIKTSDGLWGAITFIEKNKKREWKDYEKSLLIVYSNLVSIYIE